MYWTQSNVTATETSHACLPREGRVIPIGETILGLSISPWDSPLGQDMVKKSTLFGENSTSVPTPRVWPCPHTLIIASPVWYQGISKTLSFVLAQSSFYPITIIFAPKKSYILVGNDSPHWSLTFNSFNKCWNSTYYISTVPSLVMIGRWLYHSDRKEESQRRGKKKGRREGKKEGRRKGMKEISGKGD